MAHPTRGLFLLTSRIQRVLRHVYVNYKLRIKPLSGNEFHDILLLLSLDDFYNNDKKIKTNKYVIINIIITVIINVTPLHVPQNKHGNDLDRS